MGTRFLAGGVLLVLGACLGGCAGGAGGARSAPQTIPFATTTPFAPTPIMPVVTAAVPLPLLSLADRRLRFVRQAATATVTPHPPLRPLRPADILATAARTRENVVAGCSTCTESTALGPLWIDSHLNGYEMFIPWVPTNLPGLALTTGEYIFLSSSPDTDPDSCLEFGLSLQPTNQVWFYVFNQCQDGNQNTRIFLSGPIATQPITTATYYTYDHNGQALVEEIKLADGLHVLLWNYLRGTWDDTIGYGVTGNGESTGLWPATEYDVPAGDTCPTIPFTWETTLYGWEPAGSTWQLATATTAVAGAGVTFVGPDACLEWSTNTAPGSPVYNDDAPFLQLGSLANTDGYGYWGQSVTQKLGRGPEIP